MPCSLVKASLSLGTWNSDSDCKFYICPDPGVVSCRFFTVNFLWCFNAGSWAWLRGSLKAAGTEQLQLRHQDLWKGCCHSAYWLIWSICWRYWFKLFSITYSLSLTWFLWFAKEKHLQKNRNPTCLAALAGVQPGGRGSCACPGKQEGIGISCAWAVPPMDCDEVRT